MQLNIVWYRIRFSELILVTQPHRLTEYSWPLFLGQMIDSFNAHCRQVVLN